MRILNFGSLNIDYVYRVDRFVEPGETKAAKSLLVNCGGKGLNQSIAAAKAGSAVLHAGLLGADGKMLSDQLVQCGVDVSLLTPSDSVSGHAIIEVDERAQNRILLYGGTNRMLTKEQIGRTLDAFDSRGLVLVQNETNLVGYIIDEAKARGLAVAFNAAPMGSEVRSYPLDKLDYLIVNEIEGREIAGCENEDDILPTLEKRLQGCCILLTLGTRGAICSCGGKQLFVGACDVRAVDTTAAGDTYTGYFLNGMLSGLPLEETLQRAAAASALCVTKNGASASIPTREELDGALKHGNIMLPEVKAL